MPAKTALGIPAGNCLRGIARAADRRRLTGVTTRGHSIEITGEAQNTMGIVVRIMRIAGAVKELH